MCRATVDRINRLEAMFRSSNPNAVRLLYEWVRTEVFDKQAFTILMERLLKKDSASGQFDDDGGSGLTLL